MAEKEISTLIHTQQEIIRFLDPLIVKQEEIKTLLDDKIQEIQRHHLGCNIARTIGTGTAPAGAILAVSSLLKQSLRSPVLTVLGVGTAIVGKFVTFATDCRDEVKGKTFIKNAQDIVALQNDLAECLKEKLNEFQTFFKTVLSRRSKEMLENTGLSLKQRFGKQQSSLVQSHSDLCGNMSVDIDFQSFINSFIGRCVEVESLVNIVQMSETLMPTLAAALQAIGVIKEIQKSIQSWIRKHPSEVAILEILERLLESIKTLKRLRRDLEENVVLLEEKLSVITAIVTHGKIKDPVMLTRTQPSRPGPGPRTQPSTHKARTRTKDSTLKASARTRTKDSTLKARTRTKDSTLKARTRTKNSTLKTRTRTKDSTLKARTMTRTKDSTLKARTRTKDSTLKARTKTKDSTLRARTRTKDSTLKARTRTKNSTLRARTRTKDSTLKARTRTKASTSRPGQGPRTLPKNLASP